MAALNYSCDEHCHNKFSPHPEEWWGIPAVPHHVFISQIQACVQFIACFLGWKSPQILNEMQLSMIQGYLDKNAMFPANLGWDFLGCARAFTAQVRGTGVCKSSGQWVKAQSLRGVAPQLVSTAVTARGRDAEMTVKTMLSQERLTLFNSPAFTGTAECVNHQFPAPAPFAAATTGDDNSNNHSWDTWLLHKALLWTRWMNPFRQGGYTFCISLLHFYHVANNSTKMLQK